MDIKDINLGRKVGGTNPMEEKHQTFNSRDLKELHCEHCGSICFESTIIFKIIPKELAMDNKEGLVPLNPPVVRCADCKKFPTITINETFYPINKND